MQNDIVSIEEPDAIVITASIIHPTCKSIFNGSIVTNIYGGTEPYSFSWSDGSTNRDIMDITSGRYDLTVTDLNGSTANLNMEVTSSVNDSLILS